MQREDVERLIKELAEADQPLMRGTIPFTETRRRIRDAAAMIRTQSDETARLTAALVEAEARLRRNCRVCRGTGIAMSSGGIGDAVHTNYPCRACEPSAAMDTPAQGGGDE